MCDSLRNRQTGPWSAPSCALPLAADECSALSAASASVTFHVLYRDRSCPGGCAVVSPGFDLRFPGDIEHLPCVCPTIVFGSMWHGPRLWMRN